MRAPLLATLALITLVSACSTVGQSRLNPFNWFGRSTEQQGTTAEVPAEVADRRPMVDQVISLRVDKLPGGAIVHATGLPPRQGFWDTDLVAENDGEPVNGALVYQFRIQEPAGAPPAGTQQSREVTVGRFLSDQRLEGITTIVVKAARNQRSVRR